MEVTPVAPQYSRRQFALCTPVGTEQVRIEAKSIAGRWQETLTDFYGPKGHLLVEDFVNLSPTPPEIKRFTEMYAPLGDLPAKASRPTPGGAFEFSIDLWRKVQEYFRDTWILSPSSDRALFTFSSKDDLEIRDHKLVYRAGNLESFMRMELLTAPLDRLRYCDRTDCANPYFIAAHMKQRYCSPGCAAWAQAEWKKQWWKEKGSTWLKARKSRREISRKKKKNGHRSDRRHNK